MFITLSRNPANVPGHRTSSTPRPPAGRTTRPPAASAPDRRRSLGTATRRWGTWWSASSSWQGFTSADRW